MNTLSAILSRRTIRNFNGKDIDEGELRAILGAAYASPIGRARYDTLSLTVVKNKDFLEALDRATAEDFGDMSRRPLYGAPTLIIISSIINEPPHDNVNYSNAAIITENIALAATELGVGACHIWGAIRTLNTRPELLKKLELKEGFVPLCAMALGKTDEVYSIREIEEKIETKYFD